MKIVIDKSFEKDTNAIKDKNLLNRIADCIENVQKAETITKITNLKKLKGGSIYYRIRMGDYRIGIVIRNNVVTFVRFLHRKDIYTSFP